MKVKHDIVYAPQHGERGRLDVVLPDGATDRPVVVVIHGGGLCEFSKERVAGWAEFVVEQGWVAVSINYRLIDHAPYPASLEDVLTAVRWIKQTDWEELAAQDRSRMALMGGSAGGFLAMMAGLIIGSDAIHSIVSISGPVRNRYRPVGEVEAEQSSDYRLYADPLELVHAGAPALLATHSRNDTLVVPEESIAAVEAWRSMGHHAELYLYDGPGALHGAWRDDTLPLRLLRHIEERIASFLYETF